MLHSELLTKVGHHRNQFLFVLHGCGEDLGPSRLKSHLSVKFDHESERSWVIKVRTLRSSKQAPTYDIRLEPWSLLGVFVVKFKFVEGRKERRLLKVDVEILTVNPVHCWQYRPIRTQIT